MKLIAFLLAACSFSASAAPFTLYCDAGGVNGVTTHVFQVDPSAKTVDKLPAHFDADFLFFDRDGTRHGINRKTGAYTFYRLQDYGVDQQPFGKCTMQHFKPF